MIQNPTMGPAWSGILFPIYAASGAYLFFPGRVITLR